MARASREQSATTAAEIHRVALRMFVETGYAAVGLEAVAAMAGVTRGAIYHHFDSKEGLFRAVHAAAQQQIGLAVATAADAASAGAGPWEGLLAGCRAFLEISIRDDLRRIVLVEAPAVLGWQAWREQDAQHSARSLVEALDGLATTGQLTPLSVPATAALLSGAMNEAALWIAAHNDRNAALADAWAAFTVLVTSLRASGADAR